MSKEGSVAPKERVNITYKPAIGNAKEEVELPLKMLMLGDYTRRPDPRPLEDRKPINIDKDNFQKVMSEQKLALNFARQGQALRAPRTASSTSTSSSDASRTWSPRRSRTRCRS